MFHCINFVFGKTLRDLRSDRSGRNATTRALGVPPLVYFVPARDPSRVPRIGFLRFLTWGQVLARLFLYHLLRCLGIRYRRPNLVPRNHPVRSRNPLTYNPTSPPNRTTWACKWKNVVL